MIDLEKVKQEFIEHYKGELEYLEDFNDVQDLQRKYAMLYYYATSSAIGYDEDVCWVDEEGDKRVKREFITPNYCLYADVDIYNNGNDEQPLFFELLEVIHE